ncbi:MAG TPA: hypothetical protein GX735_08605 [Firmicutes bacterium]|jgi:hypothetical protein|nr:hypothetical protein [Bacillota bacterium]
MINLNQVFSEGQKKEQNEEKVDKPPCEKVQFSPLKIFPEMVPPTLAKLVLVCFNIDVAKDEVTFCVSRISK